MVTVVLYNGPARLNRGRFSLVSMGNMLEYVIGKGIIEVEDLRYRGLSDRQGERRFEYTKSGVMIYYSWKARGQRGGHKSFFALKGARERVEEVRSAITNTMNTSWYNEYKLVQ